jgi:hypothetical protein
MVALRPPAVTFFGVGASLHEKGVPSVAWSPQRSSQRAILRF